MPSVPALLLTQQSIRSDPALQPGQCGYRKVVVTELYPGESEAMTVPWLPPLSATGLCTVMRTDNIEAAFFTQAARQDRHYHRLGTEIYTVLEGQMLIAIAAQTYRLLAGDTIIVNPGSVHEIHPEATISFLCQVINLNCGGHADKFIVTE
jgi:mannose-6-phosphate isomerase-like protein (cupin superfamily)